MLYRIQSRVTGKMTNIHLVLIVAAMMLMSVPISFAQTAVPPSIEIPVADSIEYLNQWISIFAPIMLFIGMIPVALGVLRYITRLFGAAFGGMSR